MKKRIMGLACCLLFLAGCRAGQTEKQAVLPWPDGEVTLYASADLHWQQQNREWDNALVAQLDYLDEIVDTLLDEALSGKPAALLLCGDLTNGGRPEEHRELAAKLTAAEQSGLKIYVTMGNHDFDNGLEPKKLEEFYREFGYAEAVSRDTDSMSYLAYASDKLWLLSLDANLYAEKTSKLAGVVSRETLDWVEECLKAAEQSGAMLVPFSHHNLLVHTIDGLGVNYNIDGGEELQALLLKYGVPIYISGHRHNSFVVQSEQGERWLNELVCDMPAAYPHRYLTVTFRPDGSIDYAVPSLDVDGWAAKTGRGEPELLDFAAYSAELAEAQLKVTAQRVTATLETEPKKQAEMARFYYDFYHAYRNRRLWQERARLMADPGLALWQKYAKNSIYGRWMPWILQNQCNDATEQRLGPYRG